MDRNTYYGNLREFPFSASSFEEIATFLMKNGVKEMYHVMLRIGRPRTENGAGFTSTAEDDVVNHSHMCRSSRSMPK